ncbi:50S ribosomal protein L11 [Candidatus Tremblaya princeps]|uniref:Large ribosomal subunit protein uL11 n=2 Tax=Tremblaya princeps TaxID=189385 RepID=A0A143WP20_TREPR|nr:50S ribosomal protein L11 [Candidatus Tremblaya princeps]
MAKGAHNARRILCRVRLTIPAGKASPAPPIGSILGQRCINIPQFCKAFNAATAGLAQGAPTPANVVVYDDRTFDISVGTTPTAHLVMEAMRKAGRGFITPSEAADIARTKLPYLNTCSLDSAVKTISGTVRSMHASVMEDGRLA